MYNCVLNRQPRLLQGVSPQISQAVAKALSKAPEERFENCQAFAQAMSGVVQAVKKIVAAAPVPEAVQQAQVQVQPETVNPLLRRTELFLENSDWENAIKYCERILDSDPENCWAYFTVCRAN